MPLILSDQVLSDIQMTAEEVRLNLGIWLYLEQKVSIGKAASLAGMSRFEFQKALADRKLPVINYPVESVKKELQDLTAI